MSIASSMRSANWSDDHATTRGTAVEDRSIDCTCRWCRITPRIGEVHDRFGYPVKMTADPFDLDRFVSAQDGVYDRALEELRRGRKHTHWMWFIFPQIAGLGRSATAQHYAIWSLDEAQAYLRHPVLGRRLVTCARVLAETSGPSAEQIFGGIDAQKLRSSMTLFHRAAPDEPAFVDVLDRFFEGAFDGATDQRLR
jgi:uncharacterized protein (DUF1810 family)